MMMTKTQVSRSVVLYSNSVLPLKRFNGNSCRHQGCPGDPVQAAEVVGNMAPTTCWPISAAPCKGLGAEPDAPGFSMVAQGGRSSVNQSLRPAAATENVAGEIFSTFSGGGYDGEHHHLNLADKLGVGLPALVMKLAEGTATLAVGGLPIVNHPVSGVVPTLVHEAGHPLLDVGVCGVPFGLGASGG